MLREARGKGIGAALIRAAVERLRKLPGVTKAKLGAQTHAIDFYRALGFTPIGEIYLDAGIEHQDMTRPL